MAREQGNGSSRSGQAGPPQVGTSAFSALSQIEAHWRELKTDARRLPLHGQLDPNRIAEALPHTFVLERAAPGVARLAIVGRSLSALLGTEAQGLPLSVLFSPAARPTLRHWLERCFDGPAILELAAEARQGVFRTPLTGRLLLLPMLDRNGHVTRALGGFVVNGAKRSAIVKFDLAETPSRFRLLPQADQTHGPQVAPFPVPAESGRAHLRLVVNNG